MVDHVGGEVGVLARQLRIEKTLDRVVLRHKTQQWLRYLASIWSSVRFVMAGVQAAR